jgi:hypothetical protein
VISTSIIYFSHHIVESTDNKYKYKYKDNGDPSNAPYKRSIVLCNVCFQYLHYDTANDIWWMDVDEAHRNNVDRAVLKAAKNLR